MSMFVSRSVELVCLAVLLSGCAADGLFLQKSKYPQADAEHPVTRILCIWEPGEGAGLDGRTTRGFAGQIYFFTHKSDIPAIVDGDVRIYLFDDQGTPEERKRPLHQFDFIGQGWDIMRVDTQLGPAYQVFIPYVREGFHQAKCALRVRLTPAEGPVIHSNMVYVTLRGTKEDGEEESTAQASEPSRLSKENLKEFAQTRLQELSQKRASQSLTSGDAPHANSSVPSKQFGKRIHRDSTVTPAAAMLPAAANAAQYDSRFSSGSNQGTPAIGRPDVPDFRRGTRTPDASPAVHRAPGQEAFEQFSNRSSAPEPKRFRLTPVSSPLGRQGDFSENRRADNAAAPHPLAEHPLEMRAHPLAEPAARRPDSDDSAFRSGRPRRHPLRDGKFRQTGDHTPDPFAEHVGGAMPRHPLYEMDRRTSMTEWQHVDSGPNPAPHPLRTADESRPADAYSASSGRPTRMRTYSIPLPR